MELSRRARRNNEFRRQGPLKPYSGRHPERECLPAALTRSLSRPLWPNTLNARLREFQPHGSVGLLSTNSSSTSSFPATPEHWQHLPHELAHAINRPEARSHRTVSQHRRKSRSTMRTCRWSRFPWPAAEVLWYRVRHTKSAGAVLFLHIEVGCWAI